MTHAKVSLVAGTVLLMALIVLAACSGTETVQRSSGNGIQPINATQFKGDWMGSVTIVKAGSCDIDGADTLFIPSTRLVWDAEADGSVTIGEDHFYTEWRGTVWSTMTVELVKINDWTRGNGPGCVCTQYDTTDYVGKIRKVDSTYHLTLSSVENWCPSGDCRFIVTYDLTKK
ncbi:hypothetical protein GF356_09085 [candidate division GN15 bacterium]|nr:hypothetical protein [candidate division GN15 bacterium]